MGPAGYVIAILGCADGGVSCQPVATLPTAYETRAACLAATEDALNANSNLDYPTLLAQCHSPKRATSSARGSKPVTKVARRN